MPEIARLMRRSLSLISDAIYREQRASGANSHVSTEVLIDPATKNSASSLATCIHLKLPLCSLRVTCERAYLCFRLFLFSFFVSWPSGATIASMSELAPIARQHEATSRELADSLRLPLCSHHHHTHALISHKELNNYYKAPSHTHRAGRDRYITWCVIQMFSDVSSYRHDTLFATTTKPSHCVCSMFRIINHLSICGWKF